MELYKIPLYKLEYNEENNVGSVQYVDDIIAKKHNRFFNRHYYVDEYCKEIITGMSLRSHKNGEMAASLYDDKDQELYGYELYTLEEDFDEAHLASCEDVLDYVDNWEDSHLKSLYADMERKNHKNPSGYIRKMVKAEQRAKHLGNK